MARVVDVEQFLLAYPFASRPSGRKLHLAVEDPMAPWNDESFCLTWDDEGNTLCQRGSTDGLNVSLSVQTLCTMFMSYKRPSYLRRIEKLAASDTAIRLLESLIPLEQPYFSDYF